MLWRHLRKKGLLFPLHSGVSVVGVQTDSVLPQPLFQKPNLLVSSQLRADKLKVLPPGCSTLQAFCLPWYFQLPPRPKYPLVSYSLVLNLLTINHYGIVTSTSFPSAQLFPTTSYNPVPLQATQIFLLLPACRHALKWTRQGTPLVSSDMVPHTLHGGRNPASVLGLGFLSHIPVLKFPRY